MRLSSSLIRTGAAVALAWGWALAAAPAQSLLAGWTFNDQSSQSTALTADLGTLAGSASFVTGTSGSNAGLTLNGNGTISVGAGEYLYSSAINSTAYASLQSGVTIVAWFSISGSPGTNSNTAVYGLVDGAPAASLGTFSGPASSNGDLGALGYNIANTTGSSTAPTVRTVGTLSDETTTIGPGSGFNTITVGSENKTSVDFSVTAGQYSYFDDTNGTVVSRGPTTSALTLGAFTGLAIGRLTSTGADYASSTTGLTLDEIDVYQGALTSAQIAALSPAAVPEPGVSALLLVAGAVGAASFRRRLAA